MFGIVTPKNLNSLILVFANVSISPRGLNGEITV